MVKLGGRDGRRPYPCNETCHPRRSRLGTGAVCVRGWAMAGARAKGDESRGASAEPRTARVTGFITRVRSTAVAAATRVRDDVSENGAMRPAASSTRAARNTGRFSQNDSRPGSKTRPAAWRRFLKHRLGRENADIGSTGRRGGERSAIDAGNAAEARQPLPAASGTCHGQAWRPRRPSTVPV
jgi:hypothetical protein